MAIYSVKRPYIAILDLSRGYLTIKRWPYRPSRASRVLTDVGNVFSGCKLHPLNTFTTSVSTVDALLGRYGHLLMVKYPLERSEIAILGRFRLYIAA